MCTGILGKKPSTPAVAPPPDPAPMPSAAEDNPQTTAEERRLKLERMRRGLASTIKTSSRGLTGSGADLTQQTLAGKTTLGA